MQDDLEHCPLSRRCNARQAALGCDDFPPLTAAQRLGVRESFQAVSSCCTTVLPAPSTRTEGVDSVKGLHLQLQESSSRLLPWRLVLPRTRVQSVLHSPTTFPSHLPGRWRAALYREHCPPSQRCRLLGAGLETALHRR